MLEISIIDQSQVYIKMGQCIKLASSKHSLKQFRPRKKTTTTHPKHEHQLALARTSLIQLPTWQLVVIKSHYHNIYRYIYASHNKISNLHLKLAGKAHRHSYTEKDPVGSRTTLFRPSPIPQRRITTCAYGLKNKRIHTSQMLTSINPFKIAGISYHFVQVGERRKAFTN